MQVYNLTYDYDDGVRLRGLSPGGDGKFLWSSDPPIDPYCYVEAQDLDLAECRRLGVRAGGDAPDGFARIEADSPRDIRDYDDSVMHHTYEADVGLPARVLIDEGWGVVPPSEGDVLYYDIETDDRGAFTEAEDADARVLSIAGVAGDGSEEIYVDHRDERELMREFFERADDYVALVGWNSESYDERYLRNRGQIIGVVPDWDRWVWHDLKPLYDTLARPTETLSLSLDDTAERELGEGEGKTPVEAGGGELWDLWTEGDDSLREYNIRDCEIVREINQEYGLVELLHTICDICGYPPGEATYVDRYDQAQLAIGMVVDAEILSVAHERGAPMPNRGRHADTGEFPGGDVLEPTPGMHERVITADYSGMYPSIIRAFNFGPKTWFEDEAAARREHPNADVIRGESGVFVDPGTRKSILADAAEELDETRDESKAAKQEAETGTREYEIADQRDKGVKVANNCFTGDTDIMTPDGLRNIKDVEVGDPVYSINPETMACEVKPVVETVAEPNNYGELVSIQGEGADLKVTPNHRMLASRYRRDDFGFHEARELESGRWDLPTHKPVEGHRPETISLLDHFEGEVSADGGLIQYGPSHGSIPYEYDAGDLLEFMGWYISEGSISFKGENRTTAVVTIHQKIEEHRETIDDLLDRMGVNYFEHSEGFTISNRNLHEWCRDEMGGSSEEKRIPDWVFDLDHTLLARMHRALMDGDGSESRGCVKYTTISDELRDDFARLMLHLGKKMRFREDGAHRVFENRTDGVAGSRNVEREDHDGQVYCVSVLDNHTVLAGRNGVMQWTGQTLYGVFASPFHRYYVPGGSENITLIGQRLVRIAEEVSEARDDVEQVLYGDTDSVMIQLAEGVDDDELVPVARDVVDAIEREIQAWANDRGADGSLLELDVDYVWDKFHQTDKKKRYFGRVVYDDGTEVDTLKYKGLEARQNDVPRPVRDLQHDLMEARVYERETTPIVESYRDRLHAGDFDAELATSKGLGKPPSDYEADTPPIHARAAMAINEEKGASTVKVGDKVDYVKYGKSGGTADWTWIHDGEVGVDFAPNDPDRTFRESQYAFIWSDRFEPAMERVGVEETQQAGLGDFV